jgi:hypothetical protein
MNKDNLTILSKLTFLVIAAFLSSFICSYTQAQTKENAWQGAYAQLGLLGYASYIPGSSSGTTTIGRLTLPTTTSGNNVNGYVGNISAGYNFPINLSFTLGIGATLFPGKSKSASASSTNAAGTVNGEYHLSNLYSIYLIPGYVIDGEKLLYGKIGYASATINSSASGNLVGNFSQVSTNMNGVVFGLGYKQIVTDSIYIFAEGNYAINNDKAVSLVTNDGLKVNSTAKATGFDLILGVGYRF